MSWLKKKKKYYCKQNLFPQYLIPHMNKKSVCYRNRLVKLSHQVGRELNRWQHQASLDLAYRDDLYHFHKIRKLLSYEI